MFELADNRYGKSRVRLMKLTRHAGPDPHHDLDEWTVEVLLEGDFHSAHLAGDNSRILPTDTMKNTVYSLARSSTASSMESFAQELALFLLSRNPHVSSASVTIESSLWKRLTVDGRPHPSAFMRGSDERQTASVACSQQAPCTFTSGLRGLTILKSSNSAFEGYIKDSLTTLPETKDRIFATSLEAHWTYTQIPDDFNATRQTLREAMLRTFALHDSKSVQQTLYAMAEAALTAVPEASDIDLLMPNRHCLLVDLSRFGQDNPNHIFVPTDEPHGTIEATLTRA